MKRVLLIAVAVLMITVVNVSAFDAISSGSVGLLTRQGDASVIAYTVGFEAPLVTKSSAGYTLKLEPTYMYSSSGLQEVQVFRLYATNYKTLWSNTAKTLDFYIALGGGTWNFIQTGDDIMYGALIAKTGMEYKKVSFDLAIEVCQFPGDDFIMPTFGITFNP